MEEAQAQDSFSELPSMLQYPPNSREDKEDFQVTRDELDQIKRALKNEEFRKLLNEYAEEIQDPKSRTTYQDELRQLERQNGNVVHFLNPIAGFVLKTSVNGDKKAFINICSNPMIRKMSFQKATQENVAGAMCSIPFAQSPVREDVDKAGKFCDVYDVVFHPNTLAVCQTNEKMQRQLENTALEAVEKSFNVTLDKNNVRRPKLNYKGLKHATMIRYKIGEKPPQILDEESIKHETPPQPQEPYYNKKDDSQSNESQKKKQEESKKSMKKSIVPNDENENPNQNSGTPIEWTEPKYSLKYRSHVDMQDYCFDNQREGRSIKSIPEEIILTVDLPLLKDSSTLEADVLEGGWDFELTAVRRAHYKLKLRLPFQVHCDRSKASFDVDKRKLTIVMKTVQKVQKYEAIFSRSPASSIDNSDSMTGTDPKTISSSNGAPSLTVLLPKHENKNKEEGEEQQQQQNYTTPSDHAFSSVESSESLSSSASPSPQLEEHEEDDDDDDEEDEDCHDEKDHDNPRLPSKTHEGKIRQKEDSDTAITSDDNKDMTYPVKGILKRRSVSVSEGWSSYEEEFMSLESLHDEAHSCPKSVSFKEAIQRHLYKRNSSILIQKNRNKRKNKKKKQARNRVNSEGSSSMDDEDHRPLFKPRCTEVVTDGFADEE